MIEGDYQGFKIEIQGSGIALISFTNPQRLNAMSSATVRDLSEVLTLAQFDDDVRVIVLTGTGKGFVAGVNNSAASSQKNAKPEDPTIVPKLPHARHQPINSISMLSHLAQEPVRALRRLDKLTIAAVNGFAIQLGLSLVLACDFAVAARSAQLGSATLRMGWQPDEGGHWLLVQHIGVKRTLDFLMNKRIVTAEKALELGLINDVVDDEELLSHSIDIAEQFANGPQAAMRALKKAVYNAAEMSFDQAGEDIATKTAITDYHQDAIDGAPAFFRKEKAVFNKWLDDDD